MTDEKKAWICTGNLTVEEIAFARAANKMRVDDRDMGWVDPDWLAEHRKRLGTAAPRPSNDPCKCGHARIWHVGPNGVGLGSGPACHCGCECFDPRTSEAPPSPAVAKAMAAFHAELAKVEAERRTQGDSDVRLRGVRRFADHKE